MGERRYRQSEMMGIIKARAPRAQIEAKLRYLLVESDSWRRPEYAARMRERDTQFHTMVADLSATLSEKQRAAMQKRIRGILRDIATVTAPT